MEQRQQAEPVRLDTIGGGSALELFDIELGKVLENIADINTEAEAVRTVTITVKIYPGQLRDNAEIEVGSTCKLAPIRPADAVLFFGRQNGRRVAVEHDPRQAGLFDQPKDTTVVDITAAKKKESE
jgi:hypothetical protein